MTNLILWRCGGRNTRPNGFGNPPNYRLDKPPICYADGEWADQIEVALPDGYTVGTINTGAKAIYPTGGGWAYLVDDHDSPALISCTPAVKTHLDWRGANATKI